jgi:hypothetical protein
MHVLAEVWQRVRTAWALAVASWRYYVVRRWLQSDESWIYKVVAINEATDEDAVVTWSFDPARWEDSVRRATGWRTDPVRADVRYLCHGRKYRMVLRAGDACALPSVPDRHRGGPRGVMAAELVGKRVAVDVTRRVIKYQGPARDFHRGLGLRVSVMDMFPMDDGEELQAHFGALHVIDARARLQSVPISCDDLGAALAAA